MEPVGTKCYLCKSCNKYIPANTKSKHLSSNQHTRKAGRNHDATNRTITVKDCIPGTKISEFWKFFKKFGFVEDARFCTKERNTVQVRFAKEEAAQKLLDQGHVTFYNGMTLPITRQLSNRSGSVHNMRSRADWRWWVPGEQRVQQLCSLMGSSSLGSTNLESSTSGNSFVTSLWTSEKELSDLPNTSEKESSNKSSGSEKVLRRRITRWDPPPIDSNRETGELRIPDPPLTIDNQEHIQQANKIHLCEAKFDPSLIDKNQITKVLEMVKIRADLDSPLKNTNQKLEELQTELEKRKPDPRQNDTSRNDKEVQFSDVRIQPDLSIENVNQKDKYLEIHKGKSESSLPLENTKQSALGLEKCETNVKSPENGNQDVENLTIKERCEKSSLPLESLKAKNLEINKVSGKLGLPSVKINHITNNSGKHDSIVEVEHGQKDAIPKDKDFVGNNKSELPLKVNQRGKDLDEHDARKKSLEDKHLLKSEQSQSYDVIDLTLDDRNKKNDLETNVRIELDLPPEDRNQKLADEALMFIKKVSLTPVSRSLQRICEDIESLLHSSMPGAQVHLFGSFVDGTAIVGSHIDCFVEVLQDNFEKLNLNDLKTHLLFLTVIKNSLKSKFDVFSKVHVQKYSEIPLLKFFHVPTRQNVTLNVKNPFAAPMTDLLRFIYSKDDRVVPLVTFLKYWLRECDLIGKKKFNTYSVTLLTVFYLQRLQTPVLPPISLLQENSDCDVFRDKWNFGFDNSLDSIPHNQNGSDLFELITGFFKFYRDFEFDGQVISPFSGLSVPWNNMKYCFSLPPVFEKYSQLCEECSSYSFKDFSFVNIQDPIVLNLNVSRNVSSSSREYFNTICTIAFQTFHKAKSSYAFDTLLCDIVKECREHRPMENKK